MPELVKRRAWLNDNVEFRVMRELTGDEDWLAWGRVGSQVGGRWFRGFSMISVGT